jgi:hypothetical protein
MILRHQHFQWPSEDSFVAPWWCAASTLRNTALDNGVPTAHNNLKHYRNLHLWRCNVMLKIWLKVQLSMCLIKHYIMKMCMREWRYSSTNFNLDTRCRWASDSQSWHFTPGETAPCTQRTGGWVDWRMSVGAMEERIMCGWLPACYPAFGMMQNVWHAACNMLMAQLSGTT